jgi:hypothetical protein
MIGVQPTTPYAYKVISQPTELNSWDINYIHFIVLTKMKQTLKSLSKECPKNTR